LYSIFWKKYLQTSQMTGWKQ